MRRFIKNTGLAVGGLAILVTGIGIGAAAGSSSSTLDSSGPSPAPVVTKTVTVPAAPTTPAVSGPATSFGPEDGVYVVGLDIRRGVYHTTGADPDGDGNCYVALLGSTDTSDIIDNNNITGPDTITVGPGVKAVQIGGCEPWTRI